MSGLHRRDLNQPLKVGTEQASSNFQSPHGTVVVTYRRSLRAKRYILSVRGDGTVVVTVPRGGSQKRAEEFLSSRRDWVQRILERLPRHLPPKIWTVGTHILLRGELTEIQEIPSAEAVRVRLGDQILAIVANVHCDTNHDWRPFIERELRRLAVVELPDRVRELAQVHQASVQRILVRNQRSRWGSCSRRGTISLNWRLIQSPAHVRDYIIIHELMHFREMNHSHRFWKHVAEACPEFKLAEAWLSEHRYLLDAA